MAQALYRKWRPRKWEEVFGQDPIIQTLRNAVRSQRVGHAYLFSGPRGTGKTTTARLLAKAINCLADDPAARPCDNCAHCQAINEGRYLDLIEIDAASNTSVEDVRDLRDKVNFSPSQGQYKVYIIDEVHMLSNAAFNALLKTLEEPPAHAIFILATTDVHKVIPTVLSRCQRFEFRRVPVAVIVDNLRAKAREEKIEVDEDALLMISRQSQGCVRDAISLLDQLSSTGERVTLAEAQVTLGVAATESVINLVEAVLARDAGAGLARIHEALDGGSDARQFARQVVDYLRNLLLVRMNNANLVDATADTRARMADQSGRFELERLLEAIRLFSDAAAPETKSNWQPSLSLELALAESVSESPAARIVSPTPSQTQSTSKPASAPAASASSPPAETAATPQPKRPVQTQDNTPPEEPPDDFFPTRTPESAAAQPVKPASATAQVPAPGPEKAEAKSSAAREQSLETQILQQWKTILQETRKLSPKAEAALRTSRSQQVRDGVLILGYLSDTTRKMMDTDSNLDVLRKVLATIIGKPLQIRCVVSAERTTAEPGDASVSGDSLVRTALGLGGKIVYKG